MRSVRFIEALRAAFCIYEYGLTFHREVECVWRRKFSSVSLLFIVIRYSTLCYSILCVLQSVTWSQHTHDLHIADEVSAPTQTNRSLRLIKYMVDVRSNPLLWSTQLIYFDSCNMVSRATDSLTVLIHAMFACKCTE